MKEKIKIFIILILIAAGLIVAFYYQQEEEKKEQRYRACLEKCLAEFNPSSGRYMGEELWLKLEACKLECKEKSNEITSIFSPERTSSTPDVTTIPLQQVSNVGYSFYLGQIDYPDAPKIKDETKNEITLIIYEAEFPKNLLKDIVIIIINTLAVSPDQYIDTPSGKIKVIDFPPAFIKSGGIYSQSAGKSSIIYIGKNLISTKELKYTLTHEFGHYIGSKLTDEEWSQYYKLRLIPKDTPRYGQEWKLSPNEDFAEVYKYIFTGDKVRTVYGLLMPTMGDLGSGEGIGLCAKIYDELFYNYLEINNIDVLSIWFDMEKRKQIGEIITLNQKLQNCRREALLYPEKHSIIWTIGTPYYSVVDQATKNFVIGKVDILK